MTTLHDVVIVGLGAMGSAAARVLSRRGLRVLGIDRHAPPHGFGSSHGRTRMIREACYEHPVYVPLVRRAFELWHAWEAESRGARFYLRTAGLMIGPESGALVQGTLRSAAQFGIPHELLSAGKIHRRFPALVPLDGMVGVLEERAGLLHPEVIIAANLEYAVRHGATVRTDETVTGWEPTADGVEVTCGDVRHRAAHLVLAAGAWSGALLEELGLPLVVERQVTHWMQPQESDANFSPNRMPVCLWELDGSAGAARGGGEVRSTGGTTATTGTVFYTLPDLGDGVKLGLHHGGEITTADAVSRRVTPTEDARAFDLARRFVPLAKGAIRDRAVCLYTNTPDGHFIVDRHPGSDAVIVVSACSGHAFKFAPAIGEAVADLVTGAEPRVDLDAFTISRFLRSE